MPTKFSMLDCDQCSKPTLHVENVTNHVLQLMFTVLCASGAFMLTGNLTVAGMAAFGWFAVVWCLLIGFQKPAACTVCGKKRK